MLFQIGKNENRKLYLSASFLFLFNFEYKKANDGGYYVMCKEALIEFSDGTILRDEEAMKKFKS